MFPVQFANKRWGFINQLGEVKVPATFKYALPFREGVSVVTTEEGRMSAVDFNGNSLFELEQVDSYCCYSESLLSCESEDKAGFIDKQGKVVIPFFLDEALSFSRGVAAARMGHLWGLIDQVGKWLIEPTYLAIVSWLDGEYSAAQLDNRSWVIIDKNGVRQSTDTFYTANAQNEGYIIVRFQNLRIAMLDSDLNTVWEKDLEDIDNKVVQGTVTASVNGFWGILDVAGEWLVEPQFTNVASIKEGRRRFYTGGRRREDYALVSGREGFLDGQNQVVIPAVYADTRDFENGLAKVSFYCEEDPDGRDWHAHWGYIDRKGSLIWSNR